MIVPEEINLVVTSSANAGASNRSPDGSYFEVYLNEAIEVPKEAMACTLSVQAATVWWTVPNIITGVNDKLYITGPNVSDVGTNFVITLPKGLYDLNGMNQAILRELENADAKISPAPLIVLTADESTSKVEIRFNYTTVSLDFTQLQTFREILGFNSTVVGPFPGAPQTVVAPNVAAFNQLNYFLIHSDLTNRGIRVNDKFTQTIAQVAIDVPPGSQITYQPLNLPTISVNSLIGAKKTVLKFWLTDENNNRVDTNGENWSAQIVIKYLRPFVIAHTDKKLN